MSLTRLFLIFAILCRRLCQLFVRFAVVFVVFDASFSHVCHPSPSSLSSSPSFAVVFAIVFVILLSVGVFLSSSQSFAVVFVIIAVIRRRLRRSFCHLAVLCRHFVIFAVVRRRLCRLFASFAIVCVVFDTSFSHLCRPSPSFLSSSRRSLSSLLSSLSFLSSFVAVFAVHPSSLLKSVKRKTQRVRILVVRNLPTGPQLRSASFQSANYTYAVPQVRILPVPADAVFVVTANTNSTYFSHF